MPREAIEPPRSTISCRERFASVSVVREREPVVNAERDMSADWVELDNVEDCADGVCDDDDCADVGPDAGRR
jgi:hypothetical protein